MVYNTQFRVLFRYVQLGLAIVFVLLSFGILGGAAAQDTAQVESDAGTWMTWILDSGDQITLPVPPDAAATSAEIAELQEMAGQRDETALEQIAYWNAGPPAYRWNQIANDTMLAGAMPANMALRDLSLLNVAIYDATVAAWNNKYVHNRLRPSEVDSTLTTVIANPPSPSYPSEYAVTAGAASTVLGWMFPDQAQEFNAKAQEAVISRLLAGVEFPSDVNAGLELGRQVAELVIARGMADGSSAEWKGSVPTEAGYWAGETPIFPTAGTWTTWVLESPDQFRPNAPYAYDSTELAAEMDELRDFERTPVTNSIAQFWEYGAGGRRIYWFWNDVATRLILAADWKYNAPQAAKAYALTNIAGYDAMVACWDAKYEYWGMRPSQLDPEFSPLFTTPNHPSYPSAHSCISTAMAGILVELFPTDAEDVIALAEQATESRIWAGIHFRSDLVAGSELGENVANAVISHAEDNSSQ